MIWPSSGTRATAYLTHGRTVGVSLLLQVDDLFCLDVTVAM